MTTSVTYCFTIIICYSVATKSGCTQPDKKGKPKENIVNVTIVITVL